MPLQNLPGQGRQMMPSRSAMDKIPYVHQSYPSHRFHEDGREVIVTSEYDEQDRCPENEGWVKTPFPPKPKPVEEPEPTQIDLKVRLAEQTHHFNKSWDQLTVTHESLQDEHKKLQEYSAEQTSELLELRKQLGDALQQIRALTPSVEPSPEEAPAEAPKKKK